MIENNNTDTTVPQIMTRKQVCNYLKCSDRGFRRYVDQGIFKQIKISSRKILYRKKSIDAALERMETGGAV